MVAVVANLTRSRVVYVRVCIFKEIPCTKVPRYSQAAAKDAVVPEATLDLSTIGRNASRDFMRKCKRRLSFMRRVSVYRVPMPFIRRDDLGVGNAGCWLAPSA